MKEKLLNSPENMQFWQIAQPLSIYMSYNKDLCVYMSFNIE